MATTTNTQFGALDDDISIVADPAPSVSERFRGRSWVQWSVVVVPWLWFLVRGLHPLLEIVAILLPLITLGAAAGALLLGAFFRKLSFIALVASLALFFVVAVLLPGRPLSAEPIGETTRFASINLAGQYFSNNDVGFFVVDREPGVFVGIELSEAHDTELRNRYEFAASDLAGLPADPPSANERGDVSDTYRRSGQPSIGIYSGFPITVLDDPIAAEIPGGLPGFRALVATDHGDVIVYALHVPRPGFGSGIYEVTVSGQSDMLDAISKAIAAEDLPVVVLGDLNIVDRGAAFEKLTDELTDAMRTQRWASPTRTRGLWHTALRLRIDHLLISSELCATGAESPNILFSDHNPVQADIGPCAPT